MDTITITFGECVETHAGMMKYGDMVHEGFTREELKHAEKVMREAGYDATVVELCPANLADKPMGKDGVDSACVLIVRGGLTYFCVKEDALYTSLRGLEWDKTKFMYGRKVNAQLRYNLCFGDERIEPNYESKETACGTTVPFSEVPLLQLIRKGLPKLLGKKAVGLRAEGNWYYDLKKCRINQHGDAERRLVVGMRLGATMKIAFQWFYQGKPVSDKYDFDIGGGDFYVMGGKAVGNDWKKRSIYTLRHEAGVTIENATLGDEKPSKPKKAKEVKEVKEVKGDSLTIVPLPKVMYVEGDEEDDSVPTIGK